MRPRRVVRFARLIHRHGRVLGWTCAACGGNLSLLWLPRYDLGDVAAVGDTGRKAALPTRSGASVARVGDAASEDLRFEQLQLRQLEPVGEQPPTAAPHHGVDEQPVLIDQSGPDEGVA